MKEIIKRIKQIEHNFFLTFFIFVHASFSFLYFRVLNLKL